MMSDYNLNLSMEDVKTLDTENVVAVFMMHEVATPPATYDYVNHVISYLIPKLANTAFSNYHNVWGADTDDSSKLIQFLRENGYDRKMEYQVTGGRLDAGEGVTAYCVILRR
jgi:hypothetical protein